MITVIVFVFSLILGMITGAILAVCFIDKREKDTARDVVEYAKNHRYIDPAELIDWIENAHMNGHYSALPTSTQILNRIKDMQEE